MAAKLDKDKDIMSPVSLTFSKKNEDVYYILKEIAKTGEKKTEYICDAVRSFYNKKERHDNNIEQIIDEMLDKKLDKLLQDKDISIKKDEFDLSGITNADLEDD